MKRKLFTVLWIAGMALSLGSCGREKLEESPAAAMAEAESGQDKESEPDAEAVQEEASQQDTEAVPKEAVQNAEEVLSFSAFAQLEFSFLSGAGGWATYLTIEPDGSFYGKFFDGELGVTDVEYPDGTMYQCDFAGKFTEPEKVDAFTWSVRIQEISYEKEPGTEEIIDGRLYCYAEPYGLDGAEELLIYEPGAPLAELPEEYRSWVGYYDLSRTEDTGLPFWGLYNVAQECGFSSYNIISQVKKDVAAQEEWRTKLENSLINDPLSQTELNITSKQLYDEWDFALNDIWRVLMRVLDEEEKEALIAEERVWIAMKEAAVEEAGAKFEGGTMRPLEMNMKAIALTRLRVFELLEKLPEVEE